MGAYMTIPELYPVPGQYHRDRAHLMPVNPEQLFVVWEITPETLDRLRSLHSSYNWDRRTTACRLFYPMVRSYSLLDINLYSEHGSWFFKCPVIGEQVECEIGFWLPLGVWLPVIVSNKITTPRGRPHWGTAVRWLTVRYVAPEKPNQVNSAFELQPADPAQLGLASLHYLKSIETHDEYLEYLAELRTSLKVDEYNRRVNGSSEHNYTRGDQ